jgi:hypothetical protein
MALMSDALRCRANRATKQQNVNARPTLPWGMLRVAGRCSPRGDSTAVCSPLFV